MTVLNSLRLKVEALVHLPKAKQNEPSYLNQFSCKGNTLYTGIEQADDVDASRLQAKDKI
jgi:hypothetical protein